MKKFYLVVVFTMVLVLALGGISAANTDNPSPVPVEGISLNLESMELVAGGQSGILRATVEPDDATNPLVHWSSSDEDVATVEASSDAEVVPLAPGTTVITAITDDGNYTATCEVTVNPDSPTPPTGGSMLLPVMGLGGLFVLGGSAATWKKFRNR